MREKLNENPRAQIALVVLLLVGTGYLLMTRVFGASETEAAPPPAATTTTTTTATAAAPAAAAAPTASPTATGGAVAAGASVPTASRLPKPVLEAYDAGRTIVLLVVRGGGVDDKVAAGAVDRLRSRPDVAVFVTTAENISRYSAIAQGVGIDRVPAVVVLSPKRLNQDGPVRATVDYGFQDALSVEQAVVDATYTGPSGLTYQPD